MVLDKLLKLSSGFPKWRLFHGESYRFHCYRNRIKKLQRPVWGSKPVIPALRNLKQEDPSKLESNWIYTKNPKLARGFMEKPYLDKNQNVTPRKPIQR